jgi:hypothetical protein
MDRVSALLASATDLSKTKRRREYVDFRYKSMRIYTLDVRYLQLSNLMNLSRDRVDALLRVLQNTNPKKRIMMSETR